MTQIKPYQIYAENLEATALSQFFSALDQDFSIKGALMPDAHTGYSLPIGGVVATEDYILPSWVGYDIGCGMCSTKLDFKKQLIQNETIRFLIRDEILERIPVGFNINKKEPHTELRFSRLTPESQRIFHDKGGFKPLGTLGGGNHFIEIGYDVNDYVWITIHSGSRGIGHGIATNYMKLASPNGKALEGHYGFDVNTEQGQNYINDMNWCLEFALENRLLLIERVIKSIETILNFSKIQRISVINRNHNHAEYNNTEKLWIHRKGATHAEDGMMGVIPGNMRDGCFIVRGKGNPDSLYSSSHGAGRLLSRTQAKKQLSLETFQKQMHGIVGIINDKTLDESPNAYKNIFEVMEQQSDLVDVIHHIKPLLNVKG